MKKVLAILFLTLVLTTKSYGAESEWTDWSWTTQDTVLALAGSALTVIDWGQTNDIRNHAGMIELNPILGRRPSKRAVDNYFKTVLIVTPVVAALLPRKLRTGFQYVYIGVELTATVSNYKGGLKLSF